MIAPILAVVLIAVASPPPPTSTTSANVPCAGKCLAGISIGDDKNAVLRRLDSQALPGSDDHIMADFNSYPDGLMLTVYYQKAIVAVSITYAGEHGKNRTTDPYGVKLEDTADRLTALRGKPDVVDGTVWRYGAVDDIHWDYTVENGIVTTILLSSVPNLP
jgi:hypothetical protein